MEQELTTGQQYYRKHKEKILQCKWDWEQRHPIKRAAQNYRYYQRRKARIPGKYINGDPRYNRLLKRLERNDRFHPHRIISDEEYDINLGLIRLAYFYATDDMKSLSHLLRDYDENRSHLYY